jgi:hypothetical protein
MGELIKTAHSARLRLVHGEDCEGCQDVGLRMALHIVHLAGWRIVRTGAEWNRTIAPGDDPETVFVMDAEWLPEQGVVE